VSLEGFDAVSDDVWRQLAELADGSDAVIVAQVDKIDAARAKKLSDVITVERFKAPTGRDVAGRIDSLAHAHGIKLNSQARAVLVERAGHDLERAESVLKALSAGGFTQPSTAQVEVLSGTSVAAEVPWALSDALEAGDLAGALDAARRLEPIATVAYLSGRMVQVGRLVDTQAANAEEAAALLGVKPYPAEKLLTLARRLGPDGARRSWQALAGLDRAVKVERDTHTTDALLDLALGELVKWWGAGRGVNKVHATR
jgi:DNA polymerase III delta subunit